MRQFHAAKKKHPDALLFFRMGDFYEMFFEDAKVAAEVLGLALTARDKAKKVPMAGVPVRAFENYLVRLVRAGHTVAICEQLQDPREVKGIVDRDVVRVVSPGTLVEDDALSGNRPLFVLAASPEENGEIGLAWADISTGSFRCSRVAAHRFAEELTRIEPAEVVLPEDHPLAAEVQQAGLPLCRRPTWEFDPRDGARDLTEQLHTSSLEAFGIENQPAILGACGALLRFLRDHQKSALEQVRDLHVHQPDRHLALDGATRRTLEIVRSQKDGGRQNTLLAVVDRTSTPMGGRQLRDWLLEPLCEQDAILIRQEAVTALHADDEVRRGVGEALDGFGDLERAAARLAGGGGNPRDLLGIALALDRVPKLRKILGEDQAPALDTVRQRLDPCSETAAEILRTLLDSPPLTLSEGGVVRDGFHPDLDELRALAKGGKDYLAELQVREAKRMGMSTLKVGFNRVFGYYIEVSRAQSQNVPADYVRKQTLKNAERFVTPELKEYEAKVFGAEEKARDLEHQIFSQLRKTVAVELPRILQTAMAVAELDALAGLACAAVEHAWTRPEILPPGRTLEISEGRHPVVESALLGEPFVPNDTKLDADSRLVVLTGPNMSGKSTWLRQTALIVLLAQVGSFVPAKKTRIAVVDRIFTRLGSGDDISRGQSTFMVEMVETAGILRGATESSLLLLDEVGRGTSTFDGLAIAWAVCEEVHDRLGARCLFATHYHQLTDLAEALDSARNMNVAVREWGEDIVFLHRIEEGGTDRSYGVHVARLAGIPPAVLERAKEVLARLERDEEGLSRRILAKHATHDPKLSVVQVSLFDLLKENEPALAAEIRALDLDSLPPIEAWKMLLRVRSALESS